LSLYFCAFQSEQLASIRQVSFARILCDNGDAMDAIQERAMESVSATNPKKRCSGDEIPRLDLNLWVD
jgi:peroxidase